MGAQCPFLVFVERRVVKWALSFCFLLACEGPINDHHYSVLDNDNQWRAGPSMSTLTVMSSNGVSALWL